MLTVGQKIRLDVWNRNQYRTKGWYTIQNITRGDIYIKKDGAGYIESIPIFDLRKGRYRIITENMKVIRFKKPVDFKAVEREKLNAMIQEYRETVDKSVIRAKERKTYGKTTKKMLELLNAGNDPDEIAEILDTSVRVIKILMVKQGIIPKTKKGVDIMLKMTKKEVLEMYAAGNTIEEIVEHFTQGNPKLRSMYTAKATLYLEGPKPKEKPAEKKDMPEKVQPMLKARILEDTENSLEFELNDNELIICRPGALGAVSVLWEKLDVFIANLQRVKEIREAM